jgi:anthranilate synthase
VTANVDALEFSPDSKKKGSSAHAIEELVTKLDTSRGAILHSSYEFPGRYARWSLGFVDPPLEISGKGTKCRIRALNARGRLLLPAIQTAMEMLQEEGILEKVNAEYKTMEGTGDAVEGMPTSIDVSVVPMSKVGTFSEEERSRQVKHQFIDRNDSTSL